MRVVHDVEGVGRPPGSFGEELDRLGELRRHLRVERLGSKKVLVLLAELAGPLPQRLDAGADLARCCYGQPTVAGAFCFVRHGPHSTVNVVELLEEALLVVVGPLRSGELERGPQVLLTMPPDRLFADPMLRRNASVGRAREHLALDLGALGAGADRARPCHRQEITPNVALQASAFSRTSRSENPDAAHRGPRIPAGLSLTVLLGLVIGSAQMSSASRITCGSCGHEIPAEAKFCLECGAAVTVRCAQCGAELGPAARFCSHCGARIESAKVPGISAPASPSLPTREGERRQLTVLFCDLVGSTEIAAQLDPEEWRDLAARYRHAAAQAVGRFEGHVAQYLGDGLVAFFGYPHAHEDDAERGVRAGLAIVAAVQDVQTGSGVPLRVRVGLHTGPVVLGREEGAEAQAFGDTPNIAARVQAAAMPDTVVISAGTQRLVAGMFVVEEWGARALKGIPAPMSLYRVRQPSGVQGRLAAAKASRRLTPLVGRERERELLVGQWERAREGEGQLALLSGEPGIGKSRLLQTLRDHLADVPHTWVECQGSLYHQQTPFYPVVEMLKQALHRPAAARGALEALEQSFDLAGVSRATAVPLVAPLLEIPLDERYVSPDLSPEGQRKQLLLTLATWLMGLARIQPVVAVVEDLQWVDPSTLELHAMLAERGSTAPLLLLYTARPEFRAPWPVLGHHLLLPLSRLTPRQVREMIARVTLEAALSDAVVEALIARTDGVPLFVEELTKAVLEGQQAAGSTPRRMQSVAEEVPATLYDSLMARLDRLGEASKVAQVAAVLGRESTRALLGVVAGMPDAALDSALAELVEAEIFYVRGARPYDTYTFKHALMQDIAYQTLLKTRRRELHQAVAQVVREKFPAQAESEPELLARHYEAAGLTEEAFRCYHRAGQRAQERSAHEEATTQFRKAIELLVTLPRDPARDTREATVQIALAGSLVAARGFAHPETAAVWERAQSLSESSGDSELLVRARLGRGNLAVNRGEPARALALAEQILAAREGMRDDYLIPGARMVAGLAELYQGHFAAALVHLERIIADYNSALDTLAFDMRLGSSVGVSALGVAGWTLSYLGHLDRALERAREGVTLAHSRAEAFSRGFARFMETLVHRTRRDAEAQLESAADVITIGDTQGFPIWRGVGRVYHGLARVKLGEGATALAEIAEGLALAAASGNRGGTPGMLWSLADGQYTTGKYGEALATIEGALTLAASTGQHFFDSSLYHLKGELLLATSGGGAQESEALFRRAIEIARAQGAKIFELRAANSLARVLRDQGQPGEARALLLPVYSWFTEGFETPDLIEAKDLLAAFG